MRILLCDDDLMLLEQLKKYIKLYFHNNHLKLPNISQFTNGEDLLSDNGEKDIVFLDIEMPGMNGIYVGKELKKKSKNVIIFVITSYSEYLDDAMRFHVFRYLSKPLDRQRLFRNLKDALYYYNATTIKIPVETKQGIYVFSSAEIIAIEAENRKVIVHTIKGAFESIHNTAYWVNSLPRSCFFQTHRSFIVNFEHITDFDHNTVHLTNPSIIAYLTRRKYTSFKNAYFLYLENMR